MERESNYDNDGLDPSEEYFRKRTRFKRSCHPRFVR